MLTSLTMGAAGDVLINGSALANTAEVVTRGSGHVAVVGGTFKTLSIHLIGYFPPTSLAILVITFVWLRRHQSCTVTSASSSDLYEICTAFHSLKGPLFWPAKLWWVLLPKTLPSCHQTQSFLFTNDLLTWTLAIDQGTWQSRLSLSSKCSCMVKALAPRMS